MTNNTPGRPNIFDYATSELSQDAVICWLVACAAEATGDLQKCGLEFVRTLFRAGKSNRTGGVPVLRYDGEDWKPDLHDGPCDVSDVSSPIPQHCRIDVYFQAKVDGKKVSFIIEDKTYTKYHSCQLARYIEAVIEDDEKKDLIKPVYFKTGHVFSDEREVVECAKYSVFEAEDMASFLGSQDVTRENEILRQYAEYLACQMKTRDDAQANWDLNQDHVQWEFIRKLRDRLENAAGEWRPFIPAELSGSPPNSGWLWCGLGRSRNKGGSPWTQYWFAKHLFWRLDSGKPLRLMINIQNVGRTVERREVVGYRDRFEKALGEEGLDTGDIGLVMRSNAQECTIGSIKTTNFQGMTVSEFLERVTRVHIRFLDMIGATG